MNLSSILITVVGIIIIIALYVLSRLGQINMPRKETSIPEIKDGNGKLFTSILDDIPASDGYSPKTTSIKKSPEEKHQLIIFVSAQDDSGLDGNLIKASLLKNGLVLGDKDIYHYLTEGKTKKQKHSLFRIANGVEPWTLTNKDLENQTIAGLSMVMLLPSIIDNNKAVDIFIDTAEKISEGSNGVLKNQEQTIFSAKDRSNMYDL